MAMPHPVLVAFAFLSVGLIGCRQSDESKPVGDVAVAVLEATAPAQLVGVQSCAECHPVNFKFHQASGHAHTLRSTDLAEIKQKFLGKTFDRGESGPMEYVWEADGLSATLKSVFPDRPFPLDYAFGSGHNAITLMTLVPDTNQKTIGIEHCSSWYSAFERLVQTPGQSNAPPGQAAEHFGQVKSFEETSKCFGCHATTVKVELDKAVVSDLIPNVNCERCHGPGSEHVRLAKASGKPPAFSVHRDDWTRDDEISLCGECHRMPGEFSAQRLRDYPPMMARFQPIGLLRSECYLESDNLRCTTCHNPHQSAAVKSPKAYENICISCHRPAVADEVSCPKSPAEGCVECHMPKIQFSDGIRFHDHWIRVHPSEAK